MKHNTTHNARLEARQAIERGLATPVVTVASRALLESIHNEVEPILKAMRQADVMLGAIGTKGRPVGTIKGCEMESGAMTKYNHEYTLATSAAVPGDLASANDNFARLYTAKSSDAAEQTRSVAGGCHAMD